MNESNSDSQRITRRRALGILGGAAVGTVALRGRWLPATADGFARPALTGAAVAAGEEYGSVLGRVAGACVVRPEQTEGPYFVDELLNRSDIRVDPSNGEVSAGALMRLVFNVSRNDGGACTPVPGAVVDVWHCDALGVYSDVSDPGFDTKGRKYLRGYQVTDAAGKAEFVTVYPGWYQGRTVHIHFKIRLDPGADQGFDFTSQLYFDDTVTDTVHNGEPYASKGQRDIRNAGDGIYRQGGRDLLVAALPDGDGYLGSFDIQLQGLPAIPTEPAGSATATSTEPASTPTTTATPAEPTPPGTPSGLPPAGAHLPWVRRP